MFCRIPIRHIPSPTWQIVHSVVTLTRFGPQQKFACNGTVIDHPEYGEVIQVQGDQRNNIRQFIKEVSGFTLREYNRCESVSGYTSNQLFFRLDWPLTSSSKSTDSKTC